MAVNLLHHLFQAKIECSAVSLDGYPSQNLISGNWRERNSGFLAAHFIKPPVCLLVQLPFPINVHSLVIKPKVGSQVSSGIDVFVAGIKHDCLGETAVVKDFKARQKTPVSPDHRPRIKRRKVESGLTHTEREAQERISQDGEKNSNNLEVFAHKYSTLITPDSFKNEHRDIFTLVGRVNEPLGRSIRLINKRYGGIIDPAVDRSGDATIHEFFQCRSLNYVTHLAVVITRVKGSCVPAVGKLEIWGQPSSCCGASIMNYVSDIQKKISHQGNECVTSKVTKNEMKGRTSENSDKDTDTREEEYMRDEKIPSEFIDPITCSLMTIPMLLPSGLNIDLSTLEKHIEAERSWGRLPSDPFTGVLFSDDVKPLPNGALKVRIDKYILTSGVDVRSCGRTVGRSREGLFLKSSLKTDFSEKEVGNALHGKCDETAEECIGKKENKKELGQLGHHDLNNEDCMGGVSKEMQTDLTQSHEEKVSESLDNALMKTLGGASFTRRKNSHTDSVTRNKTTLPSASSLVENLGQQAKPGASNMTSTSKDSHHPQNHFTRSNCIRCKSSLIALSMFQLPCRHLMCRACLTDRSKVTKALKCSLCGCEFGQKDVIRVHH